MRVLLRTRGEFPRPARPNFCFKPVPNSRPGKCFKSIQGGVSSRKNMGDRAVVGGQYLIGRTQSPSSSRCCNIRPGLLSGAQSSRSTIIRVSRLVNDAALVAKFDDGFSRAKTARRKMFQINSGGRVEPEKHGRPGGRWRPMPDWKEASSFIVVMLQHPPRAALPVLNQAGAP